MNTEKNKRAKLMEEKFISGLAEKLNRSYEDGNAVNHSDGNNLPRESEVLAILNDLMELVFPGFQERSCHSSTHFKYAVGELLAKCHAGLKDVISRSICYNRSLESKDDPCRDIDEADDAACYLLSSLPEIRETLKLDVIAAFEGDPAAKTHAEIIQSYPGLKAIAINRIAHCLYERGIPLIPRMMGEYAHRITGIDIHPGAKLGKSMFIDHGTGVVIGETAVIGSNVKIYQGVTIGALSFPKDASGKIIKGKKRHPTIEDDVTIYAGATILGPITVGKSSVIGGNAWITEDVEPYSKITISPPRLTITRKSGLQLTTAAEAKWNALPEKRRKCLISSASRVLTDSLAVGKKENALLICDDTTELIALAFRSAAAASGLALNIRRIKETPGNGADPDAETCELMQKASVIIAPTHNSLTHCHAMTTARKKGARSATMPGITQDLFAIAMPPSLEKMKADGQRWLSRLAGRHKFELTTKAGTHLTFEGGKIPFDADDGFYTQKGVCGNIPAGEAFGVPEKMEGVLVIDGSIGGFPWTPKSPSCKVTVRKNMAVAFEGERALALKEALANAGKMAFLAAEFGIGINENLKLTGNLLGDEKVRGTCHIAFGNNAGMGGKNDVPVHIDCLVQKPTLVIDGIVCMENGIWKI